MKKLLEELNKIEEAFKFDKTIYDMRGNSIKSKDGYEDYTVTKDGIVVNGRRTLTWEAIKLLYLTAKKKGHM